MQTVKRVIRTMVSAIVLLACGGVILFTSGSMMSSSTPTPSASGEAPVKDGLPKREPVKYTALGGSYASGISKELVPGSGRCGRGVMSYPNQIARDMGFTLEDASCAGATTSNVLAVQQRGNPDGIQVEAVTPDTDLVTITVGGNDLGYVGRVGLTACQNAPQYCHNPKLPRPEPVGADYDAAEKSIGRVVAAVQSRAPHAKIILVGYIPIVSPDDTGCKDLPLTSPQIATTARVFAGLDIALRRAADKARVTYVTGGQEWFEHGVCAPEPWMNGVRTGVAFHPTDAGNTALAKAVMEAIPDSLRKHQ